MTRAEKENGRVAAPVKKTFSDTQSSTREILVGSYEGSRLKAAA